ncbi:pectin lyase fold/virulence factor [Aspergillus pseudodeflectus]|uniref:Pectin lyase fold/virulence factor n=1 Tax=Aspergillus pseudodeflectus TaxID=176178 RepID=A0ABR4KQP4_9EURO
MHLSKLLTFLAAATSVSAGTLPRSRKTCVVPASGTNTTDDAPAIIRAFKRCGRRGKVVFKPTTYHVNSVMDIRWLEDVEIDFRGNLLWSTDIPYWLNNSLEVGYQNQSTAWILGGNNVRFNGHGVGTLDGNGDYWYEWIREQENTSNYPGRPIALTFNGLTNSVVRGVNFLRSQMWTLAIIYSHHVDFENIFVNNTGNRVDSSNTDGADTIRSSHLNFNNLTVYNGDDSISFKANSTDITLRNSHFYNGLGVAIGSIGQLNDQYETVERIRVENVKFENTLHAVYFKTWTDDQNGYPPNGGGGGLGYASDMLFKNLQTTDMRGSAVAISQCTRFRGAPGQGNCTNSQFQIRDITIANLKGTTESERVTSFQCSAVAPCTNIGMFGIDLEFANGTAAEEYLCGNVKDPRGFECTGEVCVGGSATGDMLILRSLAFASGALASCWRNTTCTGPIAAAFSGPWDENNFAPASRTVQPKSILSLPAGESISDYPSNTIPSINSSDGGLVFDFGLEVGGIITIDYVLSAANATLGLAFTEAKDFIGRKSDNSNGGTGADLALLTTLSETEGSYTMPDAKLRGGFRYLTVFLDSDADATLEIKDITLELAFQPTWSNLRAYQGYFHSSDTLLNKIWYAGAYTLQTNSVPGNTCRVNPSSATGWNNNAYCGPGDSLLLDGAKRDRWVWIGDMGVAVPSASVSTGDLESTKNALLAIWNYQTSSGLLPKAGPPYLKADSDTYHLWTIIGTYNYFLFSGDTEFLLDLWPKYTKALEYSLGKITGDGLLNATQTADWGRWNYGTVAASANMLLYRALTTAAFLAPFASDETDYTSLASSLRTAITTHLYDSSVGALRDSPNATLYPQDANSMALAYALFEPGSAESEAIGTYLESNWTPTGPEVPELPNNISPFISSIELEGHFAAGHPERAIELIRRLWGWYLNHPNGTESTVPEGFLVDGRWTYRGDRGYRNDPRYMSHAHGWSSGPTSALTEYAVGLRITEPRGAEWSLKPASFKVDGLGSASAGFTTELGKFSAAFQVKGKRVKVYWNTPKGTKGWVEVPGAKGRWVKGGEGSLTVSLK